jgi:Cu/Ag efflux protein CusF
VAGDDTTITIRTAAHGALALCLLLSCGRGAGDPKPAASAPGDVVYPVRGIVKAIASDRRSITIDHEEIPDFMDAMEMEFTVPDPAVLQGIEAGAYVEGLMRRRGRSLDITRLAKAVGSLPPEPAAPSPPRSAPPSPR